ncbi:MAG: AAA family ATPase [Alphaproteobacteria bacterium]|nr:AAA family ATPase [Alphaproteobacteria bacterium]MBP9777308.1 AAA family ATPase [Alphaproteobacteria bacterium]
MAIQFARCEYVSRSSGGNACRKASYNQREDIRCERTGELFSFKERGGNVHHEIILPKGADEKFKNSSVLWNEAEACEGRSNSQVAKEFVIALPDNEEMTLEDRVELTRRFGNIFVERGVAAQLDVHAPHESEKNWHGHLLVTTRRFSNDGLTFDAKARDLDPIIRSGTVVEADLWGEVWRDLQNTFFEEKGYDIRVDAIGIVPQEHLGPVRMRHHLNEAVLRSQLLQKANEKLAKNPLSILEEMTRTQAVFTQKDVEFFFQKHVPSNEREGLLEKVLEHSQTIPLYDKETREKTGFSTTQRVRTEEEKLIRFADSIAKKSAVRLSAFSIEKGMEGKNLSNEQKIAYDLCVDSEKNLALIQGRAGVGKSYLLDAMRVAHEVEGFRVLGLAPTNKVAMDLRKEGFEAKTCHSFLFAFKNNRETLDSKTLVIVDEAGMLGTTLSVEIFNVIKNKGAKLILVGDDRQLSSVERGGTFRFLADRYTAVELSEVRRQTIGWQKEVSEALAEGNVKRAVHLLEEHKALVWSTTKEESLTNLLKDWGKDTLLNPQDTRQIIAQRNVDVDALNQGARDLLRQSGQLGEVEITCSTQRGRVAFAEGDRIQLTNTDKSQGLMNGSFGTIEKIDSKTKNITLHLDNGEVKDLNPNTYDGLRHGYAATVYKTQGANLVSVYALHSKRTNQPTNYVGLTRQTKSLSLYVSQDETPSIAHLIRQMERQQEKGTSLVFDTFKDIEKQQQEKTFFSPVKEVADILLTKVKDKFHKNEAFYQFEKEKSPSQEAAVVSVFKESERALENKLENVLSLTKVKSQPPIPHNVSTLVDVKAVENVIKENLADFADHVFASIGESHNRAMSSSVEKRYGKKGEFSINLHTGLWVNHKNTELAGGPMHLLTKLKNLSFKDAIAYGASWARLSPEQLSLRKQSVAPSHSQNTEKDNLEKEAAKNKQKIERAQALWAKGQPIQRSIAERYLKEQRRIEGELPQDFRHLPNVKVTGEQNSGTSYPCLMVAARSREGDVTAVQLTFLDPSTANKANILVQKRSYGLLKGSAVTIQENKSSNLLFIAEGVETALSLKEAGLQGYIKASLGIANIKRLEPRYLRSHIIICGDHDAPDSPASKSLEKSAQSLEERGFKVTIIKPDYLGEDFNDVLKKHGPEGVREILKQAVSQALIQPVATKDSSPTSIKTEAEKVLHEIIQTCEKYMYAYMAEENISLTNELKERIPLQAERAANLIFYAHTLNGPTPTEKETKLFIARAKYELDRIPQIKEKFTEEWHKNGNFDEQKDPLLIHMIADRQVSIEGRLFFEAKQAGQKPPLNIPQLAEAEFKAHRAETKALAQRLGSQYSLSENAATECARNIFRYQENHGSKPTDTQMTAMVEIAHQIEEKYPDFLEKDLGSHNLTYLRRMNGDLMFREGCYNNRHSIAQEHDMLKMQEKTLLEVQKQRIEQEVSRQKERDFSMSM